MFTPSTVIKTRVAPCRAEAERQARIHGTAWRSVADSQRVAWGD